MFEKSEISKKTFWVIFKHCGLVGSLAQQKPTVLASWFFYLLHHLASTSRKYGWLL